MLPGSWCEEEERKRCLLWLFGLLRDCCEKGGNSPEDIENKKEREISEAYTKLYRQLECGERDTSFWRRAKYEEICAEGAL